MKAGTCSTRTTPSQTSSSAARTRARPIRVRVIARPPVRRRAGRRARGGSPERAHRIVERRNATVVAVGDASAAAHEVGGGDPAQQAGRPRAIGTGQAIEISGDRARRRQDRPPVAAEGDAGYLARARNERGAEVRQGDEVGDPRCAQDRTRVVPAVERRDDRLVPRLAQGRGEVEERQVRLVIRADEQHAHAFSSRGHAAPRTT